MSPMTSIGVHEAKTRFSEILRQVENGEEVIVTRGGKPVARITALEALDPAPARYGLLAGEIVDAGDWEEDAEVADLFGIPRE